MSESIAVLGRKLRAKETTAVALTQAALDAVAAKDAALHSFVLVTPERAMAEAKAADAAFAAGKDLGPMQGVPYALKDIYDTANIRTTCHSKLLIDNIPAADCVVAEKLTAGGGVMIGKLATHEFAIGGPSFDLPFPPARNPWNSAHITGGSSSGSGAAVAAGLVRMAMGSDTGGSIRGPAAYCGTVGMKATYGRVSRRGVFPLSYTLDHTGPLTRSVEDAAITLQVIAGYDKLDPASANEPVDDYLSGLEGGVAGMRFGVPRAFFATALATTPDMLAAFDATCDALRAAGAVVEDIVLPDYALFAACGRIILSAEAYAIHEKDMQTRMGDYGEFTQQRFLLGATITSADLVQAFRVRRELTDAVNGALGQYDALLTASALAVAPAFDAIPDPAKNAIAPMQTIPFNVTGHPAMSVPTGKGAGGLPVSLQIVGRPFDEATVFRIGRTIEKHTGWDGPAGVPPGM
ncbi:amidase [Acidisphaera sp. L21]|uniref:amidase n=1 Tax=Acidisphaera sp. L21 TaxID=1641851 RepID=UPI00131C9CF8|nr:amidase [Acidisphaera sp. L21]